MRISEARFFLIAGGLHGALLLLAFFAPLPSFARFLGAPIEVAVEIEMDETRPPIPPRIEAPGVRTESPRSEQMPQVARTERAPSAVQVEPGPAPTSAPSVEPQTAVVPVAPGPATTSEYSGPPPAVAIGPGGGLPSLGAAPWTYPGGMPEMGKPAPAPTSAPVAKVDKDIATKVLKDAVREKDKALGLGLDNAAAGVVASSIKAAVQATDTPPESRATFEVRLSPTGQVLSARVTSSAGGSSATWARAASVAVAGLKGRTLALTSDYAKGAVMYCSVSSTVTLPDGSKSAITQQGAGATFDVSNIGAHKQRVVRPASCSLVAVK